GASCLRAAATPIRSRIASSQRRRGTEDSVQSHEVFSLQCFCALEKLARTRIGLANFLFLPIGHGQNAERKNLVNLRPVEQIAWALRRDLGIVVQNDGR